MTTTVVIPTKNESIGIKEVLPKVDLNWADEWFLVDNHSTDGTIEWCKANGYTVLQQEKPGYGQYAMKFSYITGNDVWENKDNEYSHARAVRDEVKEDYEPEWRKQTKKFEGQLGNYSSGNGLKNDEPLHDLREKGLPAYPKSS